MVAPARTPVPARSGTRTGRDPALDLVRLLGVVAVVAGHTWTDGWVRDATFPWHVPVFFVLTGYLWRPRSWGREVFARAATLLRPYVLWLVVAAAAVAGLAAAGYVDPVEPTALLWGGAALGGPLTAFWFVTCLFGACVLYAAADRAGPAGRMVAAGVALVAVAVGSPWLAATPLAIGVALPALLFVEAGRLLRRGAASIDHAVVPAVLLLAAAGVGVVAGVAPQVDLKTGTFGGIVGVAVGIVVSAALLVLARPVAAAFGPRARQAVGTTATALVPVVLLHPVILALPAWGGDGQRFVLAVLAPLALALLLGRTRLAGWALGR